MSTDIGKTALGIFEAALDVPRDERSSWVARECASDMELVAEVRSLLSAHNDAASFLDDELTVQQATNGHSNAAEAAIRPGRQLGDFLIDCEIGAGGMGVVYRALQLSLNRNVALKVLPPHLRSSENARVRFQREIEAAARLRHRNIVAVYTTGESQGTEYYAMELIEGAPLSRVIDELRRRPLSQAGSGWVIGAAVHRSDESTQTRASDLTPSPESKSPVEVELSTLVTADGYFVAVARLVKQVAEGLAFAHEMQVIHRDIKPSNLLLGRDGEIHISDFGLARLAEEPGLTRTGDFLGTPYYMAPEQISAAAGTVDERTDVYAIGATLYELLTLQKPFPGESREQVIAKILHKELASPRTIHRQVPRDLETICLKAMEKEPARRYQSASAVAEDLQRFIDRRPILARRAGPIGHGVKWVGRHRAWSAAIAGMCSLIVLAGALSYRTRVAEARLTDAEFGRVFEDAQLAALEGNLDRANAAIRDAEQLGAPAGQLSLLRGQVALQAGKHQDACDELERAVQAMPRSLAAHASLMRAYEVNQEREKRRRIAPVVASLKPKTLEDYLLLGDALSYTDVEGAQATLDEAVRRHKNSVVARLTRGSMLVYLATESAQVDQAEAALADLRIANELLEPNAYLISRIVEAELTAVTAYGIVGDAMRRQRHLDRAAVAVESLKEFPKEFRSHQWRAIYFDYIGDDEHAVESWRGMKDHSITFLVLTLQRLGRVDEAIKLCDERRARYKKARISDFLRSFAIAAKSDSPEKFVAEFEPQAKETMDSNNAVRFGYTTYCLAGDLDRAREYCRSMRTSSGDLSADEQLWETIVKYTCGELDEAALLAGVAVSRPAQCYAHFYIGMTRFAEGDRDGAREHFRKASEYKIPLCVDEHMGRVLIAQLDRDPNWPAWIKAR
jgi:serine/threonine protein kinase